MIMASAERTRVWIVEDSPLEAEMARRALSASYDIEIFDDGSVVLERISMGSLPAVLVLDWDLPTISGVEVCRVLRATHDAMGLPILLLTGHAGKNDVVEGLTAGANDYVVKPYDIAELVARVGTLVRTSSLQRAQVRRSQQLALAADIGEAITKGKSLEDVAKHCTDTLALHLDAPSVELWTQRDGKLELLASTGWASEKGILEPPSAGSRHPEHVIREVAAGQKAVVTDDAAEIVRLGACAPGVRGFAVLPLVVRDETHGVIAFCSRAPIGDALHALTTIANLVALGIARARVEAERAQILERERSARAEAEAANRSKDDFLAMVSHELRTPLNAITGWTSILLRGGLDEARVRRALETIERNARSQAQLIEDLLDVSRIVSGTLRVEVGNVDVPSTTEMALEAVRLAADAKGIALDVRIDPAAGQITGDVARIQQIIWNLLTNAIKFTPKGGRVLVGVRRTEHGIEIVVEDSGQGIEPDFLPHVFERFKQADGTTTRSKGGLGLGLAIVKHLVEIHGGTIEARSGGLGLGSSFVVTLPAPDDAPDMVRVSSTFSAASSTFERPHEIEGLRVLVVDDEPDARELIRTLLESCKITVTTVASAAEAFEVVKSLTVNLMISDIAMPDEDGLSLIGRIRALSRADGGRTPAVALTAYGRLEDRTRALRAGFNNHVAKPVEPSELLAVIASLTSR